MRKKKFETSIILMVTFLYFFFRSAHVSSLSCFPVFGLYTKKSFFLGFTSFTRIAVFLLFLIWKKIKFQHGDKSYIKQVHTVFLATLHNSICAINNNLKEYHYIKVFLIVKAPGFLDEGFT